MTQNDLIIMNEINKDALMHRMVKDQSNVDQESRLFKKEVRLDALRF